MKHSILIIDDHPDMLELLERSLSAELGVKTASALSGNIALEMLEQEEFDLILTDIKMPGIDGLELLKRIKDVTPDQTILMMTAHGNIDMVVNAMKNGAYDFITKPFDHDALVVKIEKALERTRLIKENIMLQRNCFSNELQNSLVGKSIAMKKVYETISMMAGTDITVLITGESGTGKNLVARAIHTLSDRNKNQFITVNCPTVPETILESELFGYKKGAFTHAVKNKTGLFQEADKGTIFLDEIGEISPSIQTKLLRVLQDKEIKPLGDTRVVKIDTRIIASTNQNLQELIKAGKFREDFFYRLNVLPIHMPPLRERTRDIPLISNHLVRKHCNKLQKPEKKISPELMNFFMNYHWEGNIRELENAVIRGIIYSTSDSITISDAGFKNTKQILSKTKGSDFTGLNYKDAKEKMLYDFNHRYIGETLKTNNGNITRAAKKIGLERQSLQQIMKRFDIKAELFKPD